MSRANEILTRFYLRPIYDWMHQLNPLLYVMDPVLREEEDERRLMMRMHWPVDE